MFTIIIYLYSKRGVLMNKKRLFIAIVIYAIFFGIFLFLEFYLSLPWRIILSCLFVGGMSWLLIRGWRQGKWPLKLKKETMSKLALLKGDITRLNVDAIVNAANNSLLGGGGVDGAIHKAAGPLLLEACRKLKGCPTGEAKITEGYQLPCKYIIHTVGPIYQDGKHDEPELLASCYRNIFKLALKYKIQTLAIPCISTGVYGFPKEEAARIALDEANTFIRKHPDVQQITFVCFDDENYRIYQDLMEYQA